MRKTFQDTWYAVREYFATLFRSRVRRRVFAGAVAVLLLAFVFLFSSKGLIRRYELASQEAQLQRELSRMQARQDSLRMLRNRLEHDPFTIEKIAREQYGMIRQGETVYRIPPQQGKK